MEVEDELFEYCCEMEDKLFGLTTDDVRELAFELAEKSCQTPVQFGNSQGWLGLASWFSEAVPKTHTTKTREHIGS